MLIAEYGSDRMSQLFAKLKIAVDDRSFDSAADAAGQKTRTGLVMETPKGWTGITRKSWAVMKPEEGQRLVFNSTSGNPANPNKIMLWLEEGTGNCGTETSHDGRIWPGTKMFLFVPMTASASASGWREGMRFGVDYVLARSVRGIRAMHIVANYRPKALQILGDEVRKLLKKTLT